MATTNEELVEEFRRKTAVPRNQGHAYNFALLDEWLLAALATKDAACEENQLQYGWELQAVMDTVVMLHEQGEMTNETFWRLRDLLNATSLNPPLPDQLTDKE